MPSNNYGPGVSRVLSPVGRQWLDVIWQQGKPPLDSELLRYLQRDFAEAVFFQLMPGLCAHGLPSWLRYGLAILQSNRRISRASKQSAPQFALKGRFTEFSETPPMLAQPWKSGPSGVQFHDILYKTFRDILYTRPADVAGGGTIVEHGCIGSNSQIKVRR